jgi:hypothetical protein
MWRATQWPPDVAEYRLAASASVRNIIGNHALLYCSAATDADACKKIEATMAMQRDHQIVETPTEARQAEPGPSVLALLAVSTGLAVLILGVVWFVFFRT